MHSKSILLIIGGGVAAYKALELIRELSRRDVDCRCILTKTGCEFVTPLSVAALSGEKVFTELCDPDREVAMGHIRLVRSVDLVVVCPATADLMAKAANGLADDLASTSLLAATQPVLMVPAMNTHMWNHAATRRNLEMLCRDGVHVMTPDDGAMACGEHGPGRLPEPSVIARRIVTLLDEPDVLVQPAEYGDLCGYHAVVTAGPTREPLDPVRFLSNHSSGRQGYAIADALVRAGARVTLVSGPVCLPSPSGVKLTTVETAQDMLTACEAALPADIFVAVAAVADWRPKKTSTEKLKQKTRSGPAGKTLDLIENPDILATLSRKTPTRPKLVVGFAAETHHVEALATEKLARKGCDWIVANDVSGDVMNGTMNQAILMTGNGVEVRWPRMDKAALAARLTMRIAQHFAEGPV